ncbi:MAG: 2-oxoacid:acceptor oxidoreductase family protein [Clostridiales bacterium]|jgi:2-oxoglutarate ferredoxin oxidoreductase subunit gamma|nr:2-oxoacid:acceptor oxidoreductase family protein [Clostridiales bacterium]
MQEVIIAGFGGQGILSMGRMLAYAGLHDGKSVSWLPSYGPEMRGGTANCNVIISETEVGSPIISKATALIVMNQPSLEKFEKNVIPGGIIISDSDLVPVKTNRTDVSHYEIPATKIAYEMGNSTYAGIILLGKLIGETKAVSESNFEEALKSVLPQKYYHMIPDEMVALKKGISFSA